MGPTVSLGDKIRIRRNIPYRNNYLLSMVNFLILIRFANMNGVILLYFVSSVMDSVGINKACWKIILNKFLVKRLKFLERTYSIFLLCIS